MHNTTDCSIWRSKHSCSSSDYSFYQIIGLIYLILQALGIPALAIIINAFNWLLANLTVPVV